MSNDSFGNNLVAGILLHGENQRQAELAQAVKDIENRNKVNNLNAKLNVANETIENLQAERDIEEDVSLTIAHHNRILKQEVEYYKELLTKPMQVIAQHNGDFKKTYEEQQTLLADWMVSQKAFKELAIQFGVEKGFQPSEVIEMGLDKKIDVLEDRNDPNHNTNVGDATLIGNRKESLIEKYHKNKSARKAKKGS
jgi:hypothetical protein